MHHCAGGSTGCATFRSAVTMDAENTLLDSPNRVMQDNTPWPPVHWTLLLRRRRSYPLEKAMHVEDMRAFTPN